MLEILSQNDYDFIDPSETYFYLKPIVATFLLGST